MKALMLQIPDLVKNFNHFSFARSSTSWGQQFVHFRIFTTVEPVWWLWLQQDQVKPEKTVSPQETCISNTFSCTFGKHIICSIIKKLNFGADPNSTRSRWSHSASARVLTSPPPPIVQSSGFQNRLVSASANSFCLLDHMGNRDIQDPNLDHHN